MLLLLNTRMQNTATSGPQNRYWLERVKYHWKQLQEQSNEEKISYLQKKLSAAINKRSRHTQRARKGYNELLQSYLPTFSYKQPIRLILSEDYFAQSSNLGIDRWAEGNVDVYPVAGDLYSYLGVHAKTTARQVQSCLHFERKNPSKISEEVE